LRIAELGSALGGNVGRHGAILAAAPGDLAGVL
jgi:hypothetical protein